MKSEKLAVLKPAPFLSLSVIERASYYGMWVLTGLVWLLFYESESGHTTFFALLAGVVCLACLPIVLLFLRLDLPLKRRYLENFLPGTLAGLWALASFLAPQIDSSASFVFALLALLNSLLARPFGAFIWFSSTLPIVLAVNVMLLNTSDSSALGMSILINMLFISLAMSLGLSDSQSRLTGATSADSKQQLLAQLEYEKNRLQNRVLNKERELEVKIEQRTKDLRNVNEQLNQQVALRKSVSEALLKSQTRLKQAIEASNLGLFDWEVESGKLYQSGFLEIFGGGELSSQQLIEMLKRSVHPENYPALRDALNECLAGNRESYLVSYRVRCEDRWRWMEESGRVVESGPDGRTQRIIGTRRDIQGDVQRDEEVRLAKSVFDHTSEGVFVLDNAGRFLSVNPAFSDITGHSGETVVGRAIVDVSEMPEKERIFDQIFATLADEGRWQGELLERRRHGDYFPQWTHINVIRNELGDIKYYAGLVSDMSARKEADERLEYLLNYDALTRLANRTQFQDQLHRALTRYRNDGLPFALVLMDIDRFKQFNDSYGHRLSDSILKDVAERLSNNVQRVDVLARVGGNEFACIVACSPTFQAEKFAQRLFQSLTDKPYQLAGSEVVLSCSVGIALVPEHAGDIETLIQYGALAVQKAKYQGGNQIQVFDESLKTFSRERLEMEKELRKALTNGELEVYYQPKLDLHTGLIQSYEALIRWAHPEKGLISPQEFVDIAEENGLITDLGSYVLRAACEQTKTWQDAGYGDLSVSVNLSPRQLVEPSIQSIIANSIESSALNPASLELELTESAMMGDLSGTAEVLNAVRSLGVKVSVDDFGTGYSSLSYLSKLPVDTLKIDREFIVNIENSKEQQAIVKAIVVLGASLDLKVVAEGAENEQQLELLREYGCDYVQGYYVSKPLDRVSMEALLGAQTI